MVIVSEALLPQLNGIPRSRLRYLQEIVVVGNAPRGTRAFSELLQAGSPQLEAEPTCKDDAAGFAYVLGWDHPRCTKPLTAAKAAWEARTGDTVKLASRTLE